MPIVVAINTSLAARNGMLVYDPIAMEQAREPDAIIFDKPGTLIEGEHGVVGKKTVDGVDEDEALVLVAAVESDSEYIIARAIHEAAAERALTVPDAADFESIKGRGVGANVNGNEAYVGGPNRLTQLDSKIPAHLQRVADEAG